MPAGQFLSTNSTSVKTSNGKDYNRLLGKRKSHPFRKGAREK